MGVMVYYRRGLYDVQQMLSSDTLPMAIHDRVFAGFVGQTRMFSRLFSRLYMAWATCHYFAQSPISTNKIAAKGDLFMLYQTCLRGWVSVRELSQVFKIWTTQASLKPVF